MKGLDLVFRMRLASAHWGRDWSITNPAVDFLSNDTGHFLDVDVPASQDDRLRRGKNCLDDSRIETTSRPENGLDSLLKKTCKTTGRATDDAVRRGSLRLY
jgi:hypothetical protein